MNAGTASFVLALRDSLLMTERLNCRLGHGEDSLFTTP